MLPSQGAVSLPMLVVGGDSRLGRALTAYWRRLGQPVLSTTRGASKGLAKTIPLDLARDDWFLPEARAAVLCACVTSQASCRDSPLETQRVNVHRTLELARRLAETGAFVVFVSTNLVFDGSEPLRHEHDPVSPQTEYGRQKAQVEAALLSTTPRAAVVRLGKVIQPEMALFRGWIADLNSGRPVQAFSNYRCSPVTLEMATALLARVSESQARGVWQLSAPDEVSYLEIAQHFSRRLTNSRELVSAAQANLDALEHLPEHTSLYSRRAELLLGRTAPESRAALDEVFFPESPGEPAAGASAPGERG